MHKLIALSLAVWALASISPVQDEQVVGSVMGLEGPWRVVGSTDELHEGAILTAAAKLELDADASPVLHHTVYIWLAGSSPGCPCKIECLGAECDREFSVEEECTTPGVLARAAETFRNIVAAVMPLLGEHREYVTTAARGGEIGVALSDGIALIDAGRLSLESVVEVERTGRYSAKLEPLPNRGESHTFEVDWQADRTPHVGLSPGPGLYRLVVRPAEPNSPPEDKTVAALVRASADPQQRTAFLDLRERLSQCDGTPEKILESQLRRYLAETSIWQRSR